jgi:hypothetical protein
MMQFIAAAFHDADVFRAFMETVLCLAFPQDVMARPDVAAKIAKFEGQIPPASPSISHEGLLALLGS